MSVVCSWAIFSDRTQFTPCGVTSFRSIVQVTVGTLVYPLSAATRAVFGVRRRERFVATTGRICRRTRHIPVYHATDVCATRSRRTRCARGGSSYVVRPFSGRALNAFGVASSCCIISGSARDATSRGSASNRSQIFTGGTRSAIRRSDVAIFSGWAVCRQRGVIARCSSLGLGHHYLPSGTFGTPRSISVQGDITTRLAVFHEVPSRTRAFFCRVSRQQLVAAH